MFKIIIQYNATCEYFRLEHLLRRGMFPAAKQFAEEYGLDKEKIYKAQAAMISQKTGSDNDILLEVLDQIKDVKFVVECCSKALTNDLFQTRKLFEYSYKRLKLENLVSKCWFLFLLPTLKK